MEIGLSEIVLIVAILFCTSSLFRLVVRAACHGFQEGYQGKDSSSNRTGRSSADGSGKDGEEYRPLEGKETDPYAVLDIRRAATQDEITAAYRKLAQLYHPDKVAGLAPEYKEIAERKMKSINEAYRRLKK
jgi:DnaJ-domain-containing protein 1